MTTHTELAPPLSAEPDFRERARGVFFDAMRSGYAATPQKGTIAALPGSKTIEYVDGLWRVLDTYLTSSQSAYSGGTTHIWHDDVPVWMMQYVGLYPKEAVPCLKAALKANYEAGTFYGGRGPFFFRHGSHMYVNNVKNNCFHGDVFGTEAVLDASGTEIGWHRYQGVWMMSD